MDIGVCRGVVGMSCIQQHNTPCFTYCNNNFNFICFNNIKTLYSNKVKKIKCTLVQALSLCTGRTPRRGSRGIALLFLDHGTKGVRGQHHAPAAFYPRERPGTHCTGGWVGPRGGLDRCGKSRPHRDSIPVPSSP